MDGSPPEASPADPVPPEALPADPALPAGPGVLEQAELKKKSVVPSAERMVDFIGTVCPRGSLP